MEYAVPKGTFDIIPSESNPAESWRESSKWRYIEQVLRQTADDYGFKEIRTPIFERTELFVRGVGETSDIVSKEMYTFIDRAERSMTLRPEGTACVIRSFVENRMYSQPGLHKLFYIGPMFRYERPQAGRYRQHHQFGAEAIGNGKPEQDVELIDMACEIYRRLGMKNLNVLINSVGDTASRVSYRDALTAFLKPHFEALSSDSQIRFSKNILRILDSKDPADQKILENAPTILDHLSTEARDHFNKVLSLLDQLNISYTINTKLVRGLDYYNKTVFEITSGELGAQNSVGGGGRYDGLIDSVGGPDLPSVGFATGLERVLQTMLKQDVPFPASPHPEIFIVPMNETCMQFGFQLLCSLRHAGIAAEIDLSGKKVQQGLQLANHLHAKYCLVIGDEELSQKKGKLKEMATRETQDVSFDHLIKTIQESRKSNV